MCENGIRVVSLFDGISCGRVALDRAGIAVSAYEAFEIDKFAKSISRYNYPDIRQHGDVLEADFSKFAGYDLVMGGSPCTFWSIAKANREVDKGGMGWKLFTGFLEAVRAIKPKHFLYENVASMPGSIKSYISEELGCEPIFINSALVSAQQRKRLYWTNIQGIEQPEDRGIFLKDILETGITEKAMETGAALRTRADASGRYKRLEVRKDGKLNALTTVLTDSVICTPIRVGQCDEKGSQGNRIYSVHGKTVSISANGGGRGAKTGLYKIDLPDGDYYVRKLTPIETERCQTLTDNYTAMGINDKGKEVKISNTQRYKSVGNGWTVDVIAHMLSFGDFYNN